MLLTTSGQEYAGVGRDVTREPLIVSKVADVADKIRFARKDGQLGKTVFLIGAGCSITAGVPGAAEIAKLMVGEAAKRFACQSSSGKPCDCFVNLHAKRAFSPDPLRDPTKPATDDNIDWYAVYDCMFRTHYAGPDDVRDLFATLVEQANGAINWAHLCLGELVKQKFVSTVLTTNFDQLVLAGMVRAAVLPVVCDGLESLNRIAGAPRHPQLVELHGSRHTYMLRNAPDDVSAVREDPSATTAVQTLMHHATTFVVVGYGGREDGVMNLLVQAAKSYPNKNLFWVMHSNRPEDLSDKGKEFLAQSRNGGLLLGQDADEFFLKLCQELGVGAPSAIARPLETIAGWIAEAKLSMFVNDDIKTEIESAAERLAKCEQAIIAVMDNTTKLVAEMRALRLAGDLKRTWDISNALVLDAETESASTEVLHDCARVAYDFGERFGDRGASQRAVVFYRHLLSRTDRASQPVAWAKMQINLGNALAILGARGDNAALKGAVTAYQDALKELTRERAPLDWAMTRNNLGNALATLGQRGDDTALKDAVTAYRDALKEYTRERAPLDWAMTQNNLGAALATLGRRGDEAALNDAVAAYRDALKEHTRESAPLDWAATQNNLGNALAILGACGDEAALKDAVAAHRDALTEYTRERAPLDWAMTQNSLGAALATLGQRGDAAALNDAVAAQRDALKEFTRERAPLDWAITQSNLGDVLRVIGERGDDAALKDAAMACRLALEECTRERAPLDWAITQNNLGNALRALGERQKDCAVLEEARTAILAALDVLSAMNAPAYEESARRIRANIDSAMQRLNCPQASPCA